jgi:hypothetical protein
MRSHPLARRMILAPALALGGKPALSNQIGTAVYQDGTWKVGDGSFCQLLALENGGKAPPVCSSAG